VNNVAPHRLLEVVNVMGQMDRDAAFLEVRQSRGRQIEERAEVRTADPMDRPSVLQGHLG